jgi:hypothetical protein
MVLWAAALCFGLVNCFGSLTVVVGSTVADPVAVCDIAVPPGLHSTAIDKTAGLATESNEALMAISRISGTALAVPERNCNCGFKRRLLEIAPVRQHSFASDCFRFTSISRQKGGCARGNIDRIGTAGGKTARGLAIRRHSNLAERERSLVVDAVAHLAGFENAVLLDPLE